MPLTDSVIRRYTPPTCTLQIVDRNSPLSRWVGRSVTSLQRFDLRFDDPRLPEEKRFSIQGDRYQLEALHEAVTSYVQALLNQSPERFRMLWETNSASVPEIPPPQVVETDLTSPNPELRETSQPPDQQETTDAKPELQTSLTPTASTGIGDICLRPGSGLTHNLFLGSLATAETGSTIQLGILQLFDLATALDEYTTDVVALPARHRSRSSATTGTWAGIAALLVVSVGIAAVVVQLLNRSDSQQQVANQSIATPNSNQSPSATPLPGQVPPVSSSNSINPSPGTALPGVPPIGSSPPPANLPQTTPASPSTPSANAPPLIPVPSNPPDAPVFVNPALGQAGTAAPDTSKPNNTAESSETRSPSFSISSAPTTIPSPLPQPNSPPSAPAATEPSTPTDSAEPAAGNAALSREERLNAALERRSPRQATTEQSNTATESNPVTLTAAAPQVSEAREFFQHNWQPPASLNQPLEYSILLDVDGTIQRIEPLGQASRTYVDRSGMPLIGERFVSPNPSGQTPRIRVVLSPDGKVQAFLEPE